MAQETAGPARGPQDGPQDGSEDGGSAERAPGGAVPAGRAASVHKARRGRGARLWRLIGGALDPRAWLHAVRLVNYYNYAHVIPRRALTLGPDAAISPNAVFSNPQNIVIGARLSLGARCHLWAGPGRGRIVIGDDVLFGPEVMVTASTYRHRDGRPVTAQAMDEADVVIGSDVWLGTRAVVLPGARIGEGAIIGAGALVRGEIPPYAIAVGAPARVIGHRRIAGDAEGGEGSPSEGPAPRRDSGPG